MSKVTFSQIVTVILLVILSGFSGLAWNGTYKIDDFRDTSPGQWSQYFLKSGEFNKLTIEIDYIKNVSVNQSAIDQLRTITQKYLDKPDGIDIVMSTEIPQVGLKNYYNLSDIQGLEDRYRDYRPDPYNGKLTLYVLYLNWYEDENNKLNDSVLGVAYRGSSLAIFRDAIWEDSVQHKESPTLAWKKEAAVLVHELGHILGLVNIGYKSPIDHEHFIFIKFNNTYVKEYDNHCNDSSCVMYPDIERQSINGTSKYTYAMDFCNNCSQDLSLLKQGIDITLISRYIFLAMTITAAVATVVYIVIIARKKDN